MRTHADGRLPADGQDARFVHPCVAAYASDMSLLDTVARGFATGRLFNRDGTLAVSVAQEGLMRRIPAKEG